MAYPTADRRDSLRVNVGFYAQQLVDDQPHRCFATSLSPTGVFLERPLTPMDRHSPWVQIELPLPGESEPIWAQAEVVYDTFSDLFHGMGARFLTMADSHRQVMQRWLSTQASFSQPSVDGGAGVRIFRPRRL